MRTAVLSFYEAYPPVCGAAAVAYNVAKQLPGEKLLIQLVEAKRDEVAHEDFEIVDLPMRSSRHLVKALHLAVQFPRIAKLLKSFAPDWLILEGSSWTVYYLAFFDFLKIRRAPYKILYHAHNVEYLLRAGKNGRVVAALTKWAEGLLANRADLVTAVSEVDAGHFKRLYGIDPLIFPNGVDVGQFQDVSPESVQAVKTKYGLSGKIALFMGLTNFRPNAEALAFLLKDVFPGLVGVCPDAKLAVLGGRLERRADWLINPGVIPFQEIPAFIKACDVCLAPIFSGSGTRLKILEYMAAGRPVIATPKGAEGLSVRDGENIVMAEDAPGFINKILELFAAPETAAAIGRRGRDVVQEEYAWPILVKRFLPHLEKAVAEGGGQRG
ncbi:MAG: glycosyltransferase family 4 protein [Candidatus Aminicenantales bacterium]